LKTLAETFPSPRLMQDEIMNESSPQTRERWQCSLKYCFIPLLPICQQAIMITQSPQKYITLAPTNLKIIPYSNTETTVEEEMLIIFHHPCWTHCAGVYVGCVTIAGNLLNNFSGSSKKKKPHLIILATWGKCINHVTLHQGTNIYTMNNWPSSI
jgi:hypothetical protein